MTEFADKLCSERHYESVEIRKRKSAVMDRRAKVKKATAQRRLKLEDCRRLMVFLQDCAEVSVDVWMCGWGRGLTVSCVSNCAIACTNVHTVCCHLGLVTTN